MKRSVIVKTDHCEQSCPDQYDREDPILDAASGFPAFCVFLFFGHNLSSLFPVYPYVCLLT
jgi:hypothetical protein